MKCFLMRTLRIEIGRSESFTVILSHVIQWDEKNVVEGDGWLSGEVMVDPDHDDDDGHDD